MKTYHSPRRTSAETIKIHLYLHFGFSQGVLKNTASRENSSKFTKKAIERAKEQVSGRLAYQQFNWPTKPVHRSPGKTITSNNKLIEYSLLSASMYYLFGKQIYSNLSLTNIIDAFDLYTNIKSATSHPYQQISPDNAYWLSKEFSELISVVPYCRTCKLRFYSSIEQKIKNSCPFCKQGNYINMSHSKIND